MFHVSDLDWGRGVSHGKGEGDSKGGQPVS